MMDKNLTSIVDKSIIEQREYISLATMRNWQKLGTNGEERLNRRANKLRSTRTILPTEYFSNKKNIPIVLSLLETIHKNDWKIQDIIYTLGLNLLNRYNLSHRKHVEQVLSDYGYLKICNEILTYDIPLDEYDILGLIYQCLLLEGKKNSMGSYYTPPVITKGMTKDFVFSNNERFLDPCCGSGAFLLSLNVNNPLQIYGIDSDDVAVFIAKINLLIKYDSVAFIPQILNENYLKERSFFYGGNEYDDIKFEYIASNPPWGAITSKDDMPKEINSKESFSCFMVRAFKQLKENAIMRFLLPESILNVAVHKDIRSFLLNNTCIESIKIYDSLFTGVVTKYVEISVRNAMQGKYISFVDTNKEIRIEPAYFRNSKNLNFKPINDFDNKIIEKVYGCGKQTLANSTWALGIVTGNNREKLLREYNSGIEPIYTGKEIEKYILKPAKYYIKYDRNDLQQVGKEEIYRAKEKLVYKFISSNLVFGYDDHQNLFLNSANILIPNIEGMSIKTVMAFLNSILYQFLYHKLFDEVKILKGNLLQLPFPKISEVCNKNITLLVDEYMANPKIEILEEIDNIIFNIFDITEEEREIIKHN